VYVSQLCNYSGVLPPGGSTVDRVLAVEIRREQARTVVVVRGELDLATVPQFRSASTGPAQVVVDLTAVDFVDSVGVGALLGLRRRALAAGGSLVIVCDQPRVRQVLDLTGISNVVPVLERLDEPIRPAE
jgi:anti-sigma B factor antagonist